MSPRKSEDEICHMISERSNRIPIGSTRHHWKDSSKLYRINNLVFDTQSYEIMVIYTALYMKNDLRFSRLARVFLEHIPQAKPPQNRFTRID